jgi:hypothetical protein
MASRFEVHSLKDVPRFLLKALVAWRQVRSAPGALGASLQAQPFKRTFYTLSAWVDRKSLYEYSRTQPHRGVMEGLRSTMRESTFTFWQIPVEQLPVKWDDAKRRLAEQAAGNR